MKDKLKNAMKKVFNKLKISWHFFKKHYIKIGFYFLAFIFILNAILMTVFLINRQYKFRILNQLYIEAIVPEQSLATTLHTNVVKIRAFHINDIAIGDSIVFCCDMGTDENWVQEVVNINIENQTLQTTYDGVSSTNVTADQVYGVFVNEANFIGTFYYTSMFPRGFILLNLSQMFFIYFYHYAFMQKKLNEIIGKPNIDERDIADETD